MTKANEVPETVTPDETPPTKSKSKKPKSAGFIESTSFKPTWLETGPLSPDMLPPELAAQVAAEVAVGEELSDDLVSQLAELERFYSESQETDEAETPVTEMEVTEEIVFVSASESLETESVEPEVDEPAVIETSIEVESIVVEEFDDPAPEVETDRTSDMPDPDQTLDEVILTPEETELVTEGQSVEDISETEIVAVGNVDGGDTSEAEPSAVASAAPVAATSKPAAKPKAKPARKHPLFDRLARILLIGGLILLGLAALTYFVNPFARLALGTAELARPVQSPLLDNPAGAETGWCVTGSFLEDGEPLPRMQDNGRNGDIVAGDQVFGLQLNTLAAGTYSWQVVGCEQGELVYPAAPSWIQVDSASQPVTFLFDSQERESPLFFPIPFVVSALDSVQDFQVVGSFQDWNPNDASAQLQHLGGGVYQQVRRIARPGSYEAYIIAGSPDQAIDAYGRTSGPIPFSFETTRASEAIVFLVDTNRGRASILYGMPWVATQLAYGQGFRVLSLLLGLSGLLLLAWMLLRMIMMGNDKNWLEAGCPECGRHELMRISRTPKEHLLNTVGIPAYRYQCRDCTWTGTRLSEDGASISPGATTIVAETFR